MIERANEHCVVLRLGSWEVRLIDNRPVWALTFMRWRWSSRGRRCWRARLGPVKAEGVHPDCTKEDPS